MKLSAGCAQREYRWSDLPAGIAHVTAQHTRILIVPLLIAVVLTARGCATQPRPPIDAALFSRISMQPPDEALIATAMFPTTPAALHYTIVAGDNVGSSVQIQRATTDQHGAAWASVESDLRTEYWSIDDDGTVNLMAVLDVKDNAVSLFDPPLTVPHELRPNQPHHEQAALRVVDADDPSIKKASGTATRTMEYIDNQRIRTPLGTMNAQRLVVHFLAELGVASAETTSTYYIVPDYGIVAEETSERVKILDVFGRSFDRTIVLTND